MFEKDQVVDIYLDYQTEEHREGIARLIEFKRAGLPFINQDLGDTNSNVYNYEGWTVEWLYHPRYETGTRSYRKIRYLIGKGIVRDTNIEKEINNEEDDYDFMFS